MHMCTHMHMPQTHTHMNRACEVTSFAVGICQPVDWPCHPLLICIWREMISWEQNGTRTVEMLSPFNLISSLLWVRQGIKGDGYGLSMS